LGFIVFRAGNRRGNAGLFIAHQHNLRRQEWFFCVVGFYALGTIVFDFPDCYYFFLALVVVGPETALVQFLRNTIRNWKLRIISGPHDIGDMIFFMGGPQLGDLRQECWPDIWERLFR